MTKLTSQEMISLIDLFDQSDWKVLHLEIGDYEIFLSKDPNRRYRDTVAATSAPPAPAQAAPVQQAPAEQAEGSGQSKSPSMTADSEPDHEVEEGIHLVRAPSLGTFYRAPKPGAAPYVEIGDAVEEDSEMCLVEVMKLFTTVHAGISGKVQEIFVSDGELVEHDQALFSIKTDD